ncbi:MAG: 4Fe-4S binding protein [Candidatus Accumulibacter sp.]|jgi:ferredoxin|nr:4Fe-4S binding protein [Accumulibacter sp.]
MIRKTIKIEEKKCDGCGLCVKVCHEGAIDIVDGKAKLIREDYCDGLGDCLPVCPLEAISFEEREAETDGEEMIAVDKACSEGICPGSMERVIKREEIPVVAYSSESELRQWPVQIKLAPVHALYFDGAHLLVAADCAAYARAGFHGEYMRGKVTIIGCPKLDDVDYSEKLTEIIRKNEIKSVMVARMEVPCCGGIEQAVIRALKNSGKFIPWQAVTFSTDGNVLPW